MRRLQTKVIVRNERATKKRRSKNGVCQTQRRGGIVKAQWPNALFPKEAQEPESENDPNTIVEGGP